MSFLESAFLDCLFVGSFLENIFLEMHNSYSESAIFGIAFSEYTAR